MNNNMGQFSGDMDRNEVEIDLNKFMALLQEKSELKDRIRELEDISNVNPFQKVVFLAQTVDSWRIFPRAFLSIYMFLLYFLTIKKSSNLRRAHCASSRSCQVTIAGPFGSRPTSKQNSTADSKD